MFRVRQRVRWKKRHKLDVGHNFKRKIKGKYDIEEGVEGTVCYNTSLTVLDSDLL